MTAHPVRVLKRDPETSPVPNADGSFTITWTLNRRPTAEWWDQFLLGPNGTSTAQFVCGGDLPELHDEDIQWTFRARTEGDIGVIRGWVAATIEFLRSREDDEG